MERFSELLFSYVSFSAENVTEIENLVESNTSIFIGLHFTEDHYKHDILNHKEVQKTLKTIQSSSNLM